MRTRHWTVLSSWWMWAWRSNILVLVGLRLTKIANPMDQVFPYKVSPLFSRSGPIWDKVLYRFSRDGQWRSLSWKEALGQVREIALGLVSLGIDRVIGSRSSPVFFAAAAELFYKLHFGFLFAEELQNKNV